MSVEAAAQNGNVSARRLEKVGSQEEGERRLTSTVTCLKYDLMFTSRLVYLGFWWSIFVFCVGALPAAAQTKVVVQAPGGPDPDEWKKQPHATVEGMVIGSVCPVLNLRVESKYLHFRGAHFTSYAAPPRQHLKDLNSCTGFDGARVRVVYSPTPDQTYDGEWHEMTVLEPRLLAPGSPVPPELIGSAGTKRWSASQSNKPQERARAEGRMTAVSCTGVQLFAVLEISGYTLKLHAADFRDLEILVPGAKPTEVFSPCRQLKGHQAKVDYIVVKGKAYDGELSKIEIE